MANSVSAQNSKRTAVRKALVRHQVYISAQSCSAGACARVLVNGEAYWVDELRLKHAAGQRQVNQLAEDQERRDRRI